MIVLTHIIPTKASEGGGGYLYLVGTRITGLSGSTGNNTSWLIFVVMT